MDDELKLQIAASMDIAADAQADERVVRAMAEDPSVEAWARGLYTLDRAMREWPEVRRGEKSWGRMAERIRKRVEGAKGRASSEVRATDDAYTAAPVFDDDDAATPREQQITMSETNEHDADLEGLAALTRISHLPGAMPSAPPRSLGPALLDEPDDTSSGLVDMKSLAELTREAAASMPPPAPEPAPVEAKPAPSKEASAKKAEKTDDVMVKAAPATASLPVVPEAPRKGGNTWLGALGGIAVASAAFFLISRSDAPPPSVDSASQAVNSAPSVVAPSPSEPPPPAAQPESTVQQAAPPAPEPSPAAEAPAPPAEAAPVVAAPAPAPEPEHPRAVESHPHTTREERARAARAPAATAPAAPTAHVAPTTPAPTPAPAPAPRVAPAAAAAPPTGRPASVDDLINRVAGSGPAAPAAAPAAAAEPALPERLTRPQITSVMSGLNSAVRACAQGQTGTAPVAIVIGNDGAVRSANVSGQFAGSPVGSCISGVVNRAHFPRFRANSISVTWPFVILPPR